jgi:hypothetical protein
VPVSAAVVSVFIEPGVPLVGTRPEVLTSVSMTLVSYGVCHRDMVDIVTNDSQPPTASIFGIEESSTPTIGYQLPQKEVVDIHLMLPSSWCNLFLS